LPADAAMSGRGKKCQEPFLPPIGTPPKGYRSFGARARGHRAEKAAALDAASIPSHAFAGEGLDGAAGASRKVVLVARRRTRGWAAALAAGLAFSVFLGGCGGGSGSGGGRGGAGLAMPSELSAVAVSRDVGASVRAGRLAQPAGIYQTIIQHRKKSGAAADPDNLPTDSDYRRARVRKFVEVRTLEVFGVIDRLFDAFLQTRYDDAANVGAGWYKCIVAFEDEDEAGAARTELMEWYVHSTMVGAGNRTVHRVKVKILEPDGGGGTRSVRCQVDIRRAPAGNLDGTLADLGDWEIRAAIGAEGGEGDEFFRAAAVTLGAGISRLTVRDRFTEERAGVSIAAETRAIIVRSQDEGFGIVEAPNWAPCFDATSGADCVDGPPLEKIAFAYNRGYLSIEVDGRRDSFDRADEHEIVHRYRIFRAGDGSDAAPTLEFGFPVRAADGRLGWYGARQGRHTLRMNGPALEDGATVSRGDLPLGAAPLHYSARVFEGSLVRVEGSTGLERAIKPGGDPSADYAPGTVLVETDGAGSTFVLDTDPASPRYLLLVYDTLGEVAAAAGIAAGDVVERDLRGLRIQGDASPAAAATLYHWEHESEGDSEGRVTYLVDAAGDFVLLSEPLRFEPVALARTSDFVRGVPPERWPRFSLSYDGTIRGLPETWSELEAAGSSGERIAAILDQNVRIPDGTVLRTGAGAPGGAAAYFVKALDVGIYLGRVPAIPAGEEPDLSRAAALDLDAGVPRLAEPKISAGIPAGAPLLYVRGIAVQGVDGEE
jgi:hypothetical protein